MKKTILVLCLFTSTTLPGQDINDQTLKQIDQLLIEQKFKDAKQKSDSLLRSVNPSDDPIIYLRAATSLINSYIELGSFTEGVNVGDRIIREHEGLIGVDNHSTSEFYCAIGEAYHLTQSNNQKAIAYFNQAMVFCERLKNPDKDLKAAILRGMGGANYYMGEYRKAILHLESAQKILVDSYNEEQIAVNLRSLGNSYWGLRDYNKAANYYNQSLDVLYHQDPVDSLTVGQVLHAMGYIFMDQEDISTAYKTFTKASELLEKKHPKVSSPMVWVYGDVGRALIDLKKYDSALIWLQKALNANVFEYQQNDYYQNPPLININDDFQHFMILKLKGQAFQKKYLQSGKKEDLEGMIDSFLLSDKQVDNIRKSIPKAEDQSTIAYYATEIYSKAIEAMVKVFHSTQEKRYMELAHYFMEKWKITRVHLKFLEASAKADNILPPELIERDRQLLKEISKLKSSLREYMTANSDSIRLVKSQLFEAEENYERFLTDLKENYPSYHASRFDLKVASSLEVQNILKKDFPDRAVIAYHNFEDKLYTSITTKDTVLVAIELHDYDLNELTKRIRKELTNPNSMLNSTDTLSSLLFNQIEPMLTGVSEISFVLDPVLQLIPMELIRFGDDFLFERFDVSYHFSSTLLTSQKTSELSNDEFVGFAPSYDSLSIASLPGAKTEIRSASSVFGGETYEDQKASESIFKSMGKNSGLIHIATHAIIDEQNPESSYLQFSTTDDNEDSKLYFFEIYNLKLKAQLVTLSACNTGFGKIEKGEGVMSLSRAFAYAGVLSTVVSLWPASDKSTPELMKYFYQNLKEGQAKDVALNNARKQYLATAQGKARHPFYWGGFVLIGDNSPIEDDANLLVYVIPSVLIIVMIFTVYQRKKRRS